ncbi:MAG: DNA polymerase III subunit gamma/tau [Acholeplasmatales bacterium]|nr:DNA polymerase III subunit gamma/tau [Acholeplasmatales bacterium]
MAYVALYRAYRPQKFSEVVGQEHIIKTLQNAIKLNKVAHAYLFCGPRGTGKTTLAKIMAKAMNCENGPTIEPCCECDVCKGIAKGVISDVVEIDAASNNGVEDVRAIRDTVKFLPSVGKYKVYIIDEVHMLSQAAFNALLKTLEEPPAHVIFILATTEPYKLPKTILSRCQRFDFSSISLEDTLKRLKIVAEEENIKISEEALHQIAISAEGGMRDALSIFDQCISYSVSEEISLDDVLAISGNISYIKMIDLLNKCANNESASCITLLDNIIKEGKEVPRIVNDLILFLRDVLMYKNNAVLDDKLMYKNPDFIKLSDNINKGMIYNWLEILNQALNDMRFSTQKRAYLELAILKMSDTKLNDLSSLSERVESLENSVQLLVKQERSARQNNQNNGFGFNQFKAQIPSKEELLNIKNEQQNSNLEKTEIVRDTKTIREAEVVEVPVDEPVVLNSVSVPNAIPDDEINIHDIEAILNNSSKEKRNQVEIALKDIENKYSFVYIQILTRGKIIAASDDSILIELADAKFCNRLMEYETFVKVIEIFSEYNINIKDYVCIPRDIWSVVKEDFRSKYSPLNPKPLLNPIKIGVKRRVVPQVTERTVSPEEKLVNDAKELIGDDLKILEE